MKGKTVVVLVALVLVILMIRNPKKTTAEITAGSQATTKVGGAFAGGFFAPNASTGKKSR